jgi:hypothetical protein
MACPSLTRQEKEVLATRATTPGLLFSMQNIAGIISSVTLGTEDAPAYSPALTTSGGFQGAMILTAALLGFTKEESTDNFIVVNKLVLLE